MALLQPCRAVLIRALRHTGASGGGFIRGLGGMRPSFQAFFALNFHFLSPFICSLNRDFLLADTLLEVMNMRENPYTSPEMQQYFSTLPIFIQESIEQSGMKFENLNQLRSFVDNIGKRD